MAYNLAASEAKGIGQEGCTGCGWPTKLLYITRTKPDWHDFIKHDVALDVSKIHV